MSFSGFASTGIDHQNSHGFHANLGLHDQATAFRWIHENIEAFGGDPKRVTAKGLSAGSASIGLLAISPYSRGGSFL